MANANKIFKRARRRVDHQSAKIRSGGFLAVFVLTRGIVITAISFLLNILATLVAIPVAIVVRLFRPIMLIRVGYFDARRMGHFAVDLGTHLVEKDLSNNNKLIKDLNFFKGAPTNNHLAKIAKREFSIVPAVKYLWMANRIVPFGKRHTLVPAIKSTNSRDTRGLFYQSDAEFAFTPDEELCGREFLKEVGLDNCGRFVCLNARDGAYLDQFFGDSQWDYHSYRDVNVENYRLSAVYLAEKGYGVVRMGKTVKEAFGVNHPLIFDYGASPYRSDFLDVWLMANCFFCVSNGSGLDSVADIFRVPTVMVDFIPLTHLHTWQEAITMPKHLLWSEKNRELVLSEVLQCGYFRTDEYDRAGIDVVNLSPEEILSAVSEMELRLTTKIKEEPWHIERQAEFWKIFRQNSCFNKYHDFIHPKNRFSQYYLEKNPV